MTETTMINMIANIFLPFICIFALNSSTVLLFKKPFGKCLPLTMMGVAYLLFFSQIVSDSFFAGFILMALFPVFTLLLLRLRREEIKLSLIFSEGFAAFLIIYILFTIMNYGKWVLISDEFTHWGMMVKEMLRLDRLYCVPESRLNVHKEYPPFLSLFEFFWVKACGHYSEMGTTTALDVFLLSTAAATLPEKEGLVDRKGIISAVFKVFIFLLLIVIFDPFCILTTVYKDLALPVIFAYLISLLIDGSALKSAFGYTAFIMSIGALILTKELGIAFVMLSAAAFMFSVIKYMVHDRAWNTKHILSMAAVPVFPVLMDFLWKRYITAHGGSASGQFSLSKISPDTVFDVVTGRDTGIRHDTFLAYIKALVKMPISTVLSFSYVTAFIAVLIILMAICIRHRDMIKAIDAIGLGLLFICGTAGFALTMAILYLFCFDEEEMQMLASYGRYMSSYVLAEALILMILFLGLWLRKHDFYDNRGAAAGILLLTFLLTFAPETTTWIPQSMRRGAFKTVNAEIAESAYGYASDISGHTDKDEDVLLLVPKDGGWFFAEYVRYLCNDRIISSTSSMVDVNEVSQHDYVYILGDDNGLYSLPGSEVLRKNTVYRVVRTEGGVVLSEALKTEEADE